MLANERFNYILEQLSLYGVVKSNDLIQALGVSQMTILRDLQELEAEGKLKRIHGGAKSATQLLQDESIQNKLNLNQTEKQQIAQVAASLIQEKATIYLDSGTTTLLMIPYLPKNLTVVTNSILHAHQLVQREIACLILGGNIKPKTNAIIGISAYAELSKLNFDYCFIGANGIDLTAGFTTPSHEEGELKKLALQKAKSPFIVADGSKFGKVAFVQIAENTDHYGLVTTHCPDKFKKNLPHYLIIETLKDISKMESKK